MAIISDFKKLIPKITEAWFSDNKLVKPKYRYNYKFKRWLPGTFGFICRKTGTVIAGEVSGDGKWIILEE